MSSSTDTILKIRNSVVASDLPSISVHDFLTDAEIAATKTYAFTTNVQVGFQNAMNAAYAQRKALYVPNGGYLVTALTVPGLGSDYATFQMYGDGLGNPFALFQGNDSGSIIKSTTSGTMFSWNTELTPSADMQFLIEDIAFWGTSAANVPAVYFEGFFGVSTMRRCAVYQAGLGDGLVIGYGAAMLIDTCYVYNKDLFAPTYPAGATTRVGKGIWIKNSYGGGLNTLYKNSSRGWLYGYYLGETGVSATNFKTTLVLNEASTVTHGIWLERGCDGCSLEDNYMEGMDNVGTAIYDNGRSTSVTGNFIFPGAAIGIHSAADTLGGYYSHNYLACKPSASSTAILIDMTGPTYQGLARTCVNNSITYGGTVGPAIGIQILGVSPFLDIHGNMFNPNIVWAGAGSKKIDDQTTGNGITGFSESAIGSLRFPKLARGSISIGLDTTVLTQANVDGSNVLTVTDASDFTMTATVATNITSITAPVAPGKLFWIRTTNTNTTFTPSATLKLSGGVAYTPGANGASLCFKIQSGITWEVSRIAY